MSVLLNSIDVMLGFICVGSTTIGTSPEIALDRNRESYRASKETSHRSQLLSSTLQKLSSEHEDAIQSLRNQLLNHETQSQSLGHKLQMASTEIEKSQMGYRVLENKWTEERTRREVSEKKLQDLEEMLLRERREHSERTNSMMNDLMNERGNRVRMEETYRNQMTQTTEKHLQNEAKTKDLALQLDALTREKKSLGNEVDRLRQECATLQKSFDGWC
jgi:chromosome segregation ATPase